MSARNITVNRDGELAVMTICRPKALNALDHQTFTDLKELSAELEMDASVAGIVLSSEGGALAGADIKELAALPTDEDVAALSRRGQLIFDQIAALNKPIVAAIDSFVLGGGAECCMACHARVVGPKLLMGQPEVMLGVIPGYAGTQRLPRLVGFERAMTLLRSGKPIRAQDACDWGWAHGEPVEDYLGAAKQLVRDHLAGKVKLAPVPQDPVAVPDPLPDVDISHCSKIIDAILVDVLLRGLALPLAEGELIEAEAFGACKRSEDFAIGMKNFLEQGPRNPAPFVHR